MMALNTLEDYLEAWLKTEHGETALETKKPVAEVICALAEAGKTIAKLTARGPLAGSVGAVVGDGTGGDVQKELDRITNNQVVAALKTAPVAYIASEELDDVLATEKSADAALCVAVDPLDGSSNIDTNVTIGTIFSILPRRVEEDATAEEQFFQSGRKQLAAGYIIYGPHTAMVLSVGDGTHTFTLDTGDDKFKLTSANLQVAAQTREFAINGSNYHHWDDHIRRYIDECLQGENGARGKNFNTRWVASMVADCHRILIRGGIYLYPGDVRQGYKDGRLRLIYEGNPIAFLMEQSGGVATTGHQPILDVKPTDIHQRVPLIFGSVGEVNIVQQYYKMVKSERQRSPLFGQRGLFLADDFVGKEG